VKISEIIFYAANAVVVRKLIETHRDIGHRGRSNNYITFIPIIFDAS